MKPILLFAGLWLPALLFCNLPTLGGVSQPCPEATAEPLWVEPIPATTDQESILVHVTIGRGEAVTVTTESGVFAVQGPFSTAEPAEVLVDLEPGVTHHLEVTAAVQKTESGGCEYGGYTLTATTDRNGGPLVVAQEQAVLCAVPTQSPLYVDPLPTATDVNPIYVHVGHGLPGTVTITSEAGTFTGEVPEAGNVQIEVRLQPGENHLTVQIDVPATGGDCSVGPYTLSTTVDTQGRPLVAVHAEATTGDATPTLCPQPTPELLEVEPIPATTDQASIVVQVFIGNGEKVEITTESGTFSSDTKSGENATFEVEVALLPGVTHHLEVTGYVKKMPGFGGCTYGGYSLTTTRDSDGDELVITRN